MSNLVQFENLKQIVVMVQPQFDELAKIHNAVNYKREAAFALQLLQGSEYLAKMAMGNQDSLKNAIINVAAVGLTLSPVHKLAYLVPRDGKVSLDISYRGLIKLATDIGAIKWANAELVCEKDTFQLQGLGKEPLHKFEPFKDRGEILGVYCTVKTPDGDFLTAHMKIDDVYKIRNRSQSYASGKNSPWKSDPDDMIKKTVIRKAYKTWPMTDTNRDRFEQAIDVTNNADPIDFDAPIAIAAPQEEDKRVSQFDTIRAGLELLGRTEAQYIKHLTTVNRREIKSLEELTDLEISQALTMLNQWLDAKKKNDEAAKVKQTEFPIENT